MATPVLFHNPKCSKSRGAVAVLEERGVEAEIVRYLDTPPSRAQLETIVAGLDDPPAALVRSGDPRFKELGLAKGDYTTAAEVVDLLVAHPELMERPVLLVGSKAVIGRPPERITDLLD